MDARVKKIPPELRGARSWNDNMQGNFLVHGFLYPQADMLLATFTVRAPKNWHPRGFEPDSPQPFPKWQGARWDGRGKLGLERTVNWDAVSRNYSAEVISQN